jgi:hypothetical protein
MSLARCIRAISASDLRVRQCGDGARVFQRVAVGQRADAVVDEEGGAFADAHARRLCRIRRDAHAFQHSDEQRVRALVFVPAVDRAVDQHEVLQRALFERRGDVFDGALRRQDGADHALAGVPLGAGEVGQVGAGVDVDGGDALRLHERLRARDALQVFVFADRDRARSHVGQ